jgi:predicted dehydrogenase/nucleoside-diphosphate-sugar epimerase
MTPEHGKQRLRIGIVGCGNVAEHHALCVRTLETAILVGVADLNTEAARAFAAKHNIATVARSASELLDAAEIDVLHVTTPPAHHYSCAIAALERGINVFVEKPVALTKVEVDDLYQKANARGVLLCPDYIQLFHPRVQLVIRELEAGRLGQVVHVQSHWCLNLKDEIRDADGLHWTFRLPGGFLRDYASHVLYQALYFAGPPQSVNVSRQSTGTLPQGLVDHLTLDIQGKNCSATVLLSCLPRPSSYGLRIFCDQGSVEIDFDTQTAIVTRNSGLSRRITSVTANFQKSWQLSRQTIGNMYNYLSGALVPYVGLRTLIPQFYEAILEHKAPPVAPELAIAVTDTEELIFKEWKEPMARGCYVPSTRAEVASGKGVLVTGASGYVGTAIVRALLQSGYYVRAFTRPTSNTAALQRLGVEIFFGDIRDLADVQAACEGMNVVVHAAAGMKGSAEAMVDTCVRGTQNIAAAAAEHCVGRVIYISSFSVYNYTQLKNGQSITENTPLEDMPEARGAYTLGKTQAEHLALSHLSERSSAWTIVRPSLVVGNGKNIFDPLGSKVGDIVICLATRKKRLLLIHVDDVATAVVCLLKNANTAGKVFVLSDPETPTVREYVAMCRRQIPDRRFHVLYVPYFAARLCALGLTILTKLLRRGPSVNRRRLLSVYRDVTADVSSITRDTGWKPPADLLKRLGEEAASKIYSQPEEVAEVSLADV